MAQALGWLRGALVVVGGGQDRDCSRRGLSGARACVYLCVCACVCACVRVHELFAGVVCVCDVDRWWLMTQ